MSCVICSEYLLPTEEVYSTPCGHIFHFNCVAQWLKRYSSSYSLTRSLLFSRIMPILNNYDARLSETPAFLNQDENQNNKRSKSFSRYFPLQSHVMPRKLKTDPYKLFLLFLLSGLKYSYQKQKNFLPAPEEINLFRLDFEAKLQLLSCEIKVI